MLKRCLFNLIGCLLAFLVALLVPAGLVHAEPKEEVFRAVIGSDGTQRVRILGGSYFFRPNHIIVKANVPVELSVSLEPGIVPHTLVIRAAEAGITLDEPLGTDPKTFTFTPKAVGKYHFYCKNKLLFLKSHREKGMEGILEVIE